MHVALAGCGRWGRNILRDLMDLGAAVTVADPDPCARVVAATAGAQVVDRVAALPAVDACVVAVPTVSHAAVVTELLPRNVPVFVEKPLTCSVADAEAILAAAPERVFCMDKWRYHGGVLKLAEFARSGALGSVLSVRSWRLGWSNPHDDVDAVWILAPHDLSIAWEILGYLPPVHSAWGLRAGALGESLTARLAEPAGGPDVVMEISCSHPVNRRSVVVIGTEAAAQFGGSFDDCVLLRRPGATETKKIPAPTEMPLLAELRSFLDHVRGGPPPKSTAAEALLFVRRVAEMREMAGFP